MLLVSVGGAAIASAQLPFAIDTPGVSVAAGQSLEDTYGTYKQKWERKYLIIKEQVEGAAMEARRAFGDFTLASQRDFDQSLLSLGDWANGVRVEADDASAGLAGELQQKLELGQLSLRDLSRQFDAFQSEVNRSTRSLPKEVRDRFQSDAKSVERSIDVAVLSLDALLSDAKESLENSSSDLKARIQEDLKTLISSLDDTSSKIEAFFTPA
jgi:paraquat-inducible protein B